MTAEIFIAMVCFASSDPQWNLGCRVPTCRQQFCTYQTKEDCQRVADLYNNGNRPNPGDKFTTTYQCFKKTVPQWEPVE